MNMAEKEQCPLVAFQKGWESYVKPNRLGFVMYYCIVYVLCDVSARR